MMSKKEARMRRAKETRCRLKAHEGCCRLVVHRSLKHITAQVFAPLGGKVLAYASTLEPKVRESLAFTGNIEAAKRVGRLIAERAIKAGITQVGFDRAGYKFHGKVAALALEADANGLQCTSKRVER